MLHYNDVDLEDILKVISINTTLISERENNSIDIPSRHGELYNGFKYGTKKIEITGDIKRGSEDNYYKAKDELNGILDVKTPKPLYMNNTGRFFFAVFDGTIKEERISKGYYRITINFICYDPFSYNEKAKQFNGASSILCTNEGNVEAYPIIDVGISKKAHFVQVENVNNKKKILIGQYPSTENTSVAEKSTILVDECKSTTGWVTGTSSIDTNRSTGGTLSVTSDGYGIMAGDYGTKSTSTWYGTSARKNLGTQIENFYVECVMTHNSAGANGDPSVGQDDEETVVSGSRTTYYKVTCSSLNVRSGPSTNYKRIGSLKKNTDVYPSSVENGWAKITYNGSTGYVCASYLQTYVNDTTTTLKKKNFVCISNTAIRTTHKESSTNQCTIPAGASIRCIFDPSYLDSEDEDKSRYYYKLAQPYNGYDGYVLVENLTAASNTYYEYAEKLETADDKVGIVELYGYTANNEKLFKMGMYDDNPYYEFTYPIIQVGSKDFLKDKTVAPAPKTKISASGNDEKLTVTKDALLSGRYGDWNKFYGKIGIQRKEGNWKAWVYKIEAGQTVKQILQNDTNVSGSPKGNLAYVVAYFGTCADSRENASGVAINNIEVKDLTPEKSKINKNITIFDIGDTLKVDCYNNRIYLNDKPFSSKVDIGSQFFPLELGDNTIRILSDDDNVSSSIIFNERWL